MDFSLHQITKLASDLSTEADKSVHDPIKLYDLLHNTVNVLFDASEQITYLQNKIVNLTAEIQRLEKIASY